MTAQSATGAAFARDIHDPTAKMAEQRVKELLEDMGADVLDMRADHLPWDFTILTPYNQLRRVDVKADKYIDRTGNVVFESAHFWKPEYGEGLMKKGWGWNEKLDWLAVVGADSGRLWLLSMHDFRAFMKREMPPKGYSVENEQWVTQGSLVPLEDLRTFGAVILERTLDAWNPLGWTW